MDTKIIELRIAVRALPSENRLVNLAVKSEVLRLSELLNKQCAVEKLRKTNGLLAITRRAFDSYQRFLKSFSGVYRRC